MEVSTVIEIQNFAREIIQNGATQDTENGSRRIIAVQFAPFSSFSIEWHSDYIQAVGGQKEPDFSGAFMFEENKDQQKEMSQLLKISDEFL